ncbi:TetR/AcrR family transcriptional regulator [Streptomyces sp. NPDC056401]|uniref:TetR/AcrR family transcriptional regulator n=1 Tax=Streptomyces sp. NPDC056401 TaxID=3345809 RepID=UPI0035DF1E43
MSQRTIVKCFSQDLVRGPKAGKQTGVKESFALLSGEQEPPSRGPKPSLTAGQIAEAAIEIADAEGLKAVSLARVAKEFGVTAMALYRYVPGKTELLDLMVDLAIGPRTRSPASPAAGARS